METALSHLKSGVIFYGSINLEFQFSVGNFTALNIYFIYIFLSSKWYLTCN